MHSELDALKATLGSLRAHVTLDGAVPPPEAEALVGSALVPNFGRLRDTSSVESLKGPQVCGSPPRALPRPPPSRFV